MVTAKATPPHVSVPLLPAEQLSEAEQMATDMIAAAGAYNSEALYAQRVREAVGLGARSSAPSVLLPVKIMALLQVLAEISRSYVHNRRIAEAMIMTLRGLCLRQEQGQAKVDKQPGGAERMGLSLLRVMNPERVGAYRGEINALLRAKPITDLPCQIGAVIDVLLGLVGSFSDQQERAQAIGWLIEQWSARGAVTASAMNWLCARLLAPDDLDIPDKKDLANQPGSSEFCEPRGETLRKHSEQTRELERKISEVLVDADVRVLVKLDGVILDTLTASVAATEAELLQLVMERHPLPVARIRANLTTSEGLNPVRVLDLHTTRRDAASNFSDIPVDSVEDPGPSKPMRTQLFLAAPRDPNDPGWPALAAEPIGEYRTDSLIDKMKMGRQMREMALMLPRPPRLPANTLGFRHPIPSLEFPDRGGDDYTKRLGIQAVQCNITEPGAASRALTSRGEEPHPWRVELDGVGLGTVAAPPDVKREELLQLVREQYMNPDGMWIEIKPRRAGKPFFLSGIISATSCLGETEKALGLPPRSCGSLKRIAVFINGELRGVIRMFFDATESEIAARIKAALFGSVVVSVKYTDKVFELEAVHVETKLVGIGRPVPEPTPTPQPSAEPATLDPTDIPANATAQETPEPGIPEQPNPSIEHVALVVERIEEVPETGGQLVGDESQTATGHLCDAEAGQVLAQLTEELNARLPDQTDSPGQIEGLVEKANPFLQSNAEPIKTEDPPVFSVDLQPVDRRRFADMAADLMRSQMSEPFADVHPPELPAAIIYSEAAPARGEDPVRSSDGERAGVDEQAPDLARH